MSLSYRYSRQSVKILCQSARCFFSHGNFTMEQHQWTTRPSTEMAPRPHHLRIRLDLFRCPRLYTLRLVEQRCYGVLRQ